MIFRVVEFGYFIYISAMKGINSIALSLGCAALAALSGSLAHAEMKSLGSSGAATYFVDTATVKRDGNLRNLWSVMDYKSPQTTQRGAKYLSTRTNMEINCKNQTVLMRQFSMHSGPMASGEVLDTQGVWRDAQSVPPGTPLFTIMKFVC